MLRKLTVWIGAVVLAGCGSVMVYQSTSPNDTLPGIPFYSKQAQYAHETKYVLREVLVVLTVTEKVNGKESSPTHYPATGALTLPAIRWPAAQALLNKLEQAAKQADKVDLNAAKAATATAYDNLVALQKPAVTEELAANTVGYVMVTGPQRLYINTRQPLIGTASSTYKLNGEQMLTEATSNVTDDTVKTLLALFPISAKISQNWGLSAATPSKKDDVKREVTITYTAIGQDTAITLRKVLPEPTATVTPVAPAPMTYDEAKTGANGVQLVSREVLGTTKDTAKQDTTSYKVQATVTPPKADNSSK